MVDDRLHAVAVVGAGPAGLFATRALATNGCRVLLLNRDVSRVASRSTASFSTSTR